MDTVTKNSQHIIPEWATPKGLVLVYPLNLPGIKNEKELDLVEFYDSFIKQILTQASLQELTLITRPNSKSAAERLIKGIKTGIQVKFISSHSVQDIWVRDYAPIYGFGKKVYKALYNPCYFTGKDIKYADIDDKVGIEFPQILNLELSYLIKPGKENLILDGGNFIHNGNGTAIVTNRIIADNESLSIEEIKGIFRNQLNITELIIVPVEPYDESGHIDGMVRFVSEKTVFVSAYPVEESLSNIFFDKIAAILRNHGFDVSRIENAVPIEYVDEDDEFPSAYGNFLNYLRIGNTIFLPQYDDIPQNKMAIETITNKFPELNIIPVNKEIDKLSKLGGVLNCISWLYY